MSDAFFMRTRYDGVREISGRMWLLVWVTPALFLGAALYFAAQTLIAPLGMVEVEGEVVELREYEGWSPLEGDVTNYAPVFSYTHADGRELRASAGMSHSAWNFPVGSRRTILHDPDVNGDVRIPGPWNWIVPGALAVLGLGTALPAALVSLFLLRWRRRGVQG
ncbi:hypothetical protein FHY55_09795 [Oceanicola sp. D3]|uniref:DUF3592 domain-containing protein n=1 Tax=Oceanicola sp. D3 TaxID=2587163 RepID=UPI001122E192|nr:DUF3592 domain-containing protein [Oceanicola sp. D3]QDC09519.1 hypothetical protein FHY55_09795 [Oceanicola sp. D3]